MAEICTSCRAALLPGAAFCAGCGTRVAPTCDACGDPLVPGAAFCGECGARQAAAEAAPAATTPAPPTPSTPPAPPVPAVSQAATPPPAPSVPPSEPVAPPTITQAVPPPAPPSNGDAPPGRPTPGAPGPRLSTRTLGLIGGGVLVLLLALVVVRLAAGGEEAPAPAPPRSDAQAPAVSATPAVAEASATATPEPAAAALPETPSDDPTELAAEIDRAEEILHDSASDDDLEAAGRYEQMATLRLNAADSQFRRSAFAAMGGDAHAAMRATTDAAKAIAVVVEPQKRFPKWRIVSPPPPQTLQRYFQSAQNKTGVPWEYLAAIQFVETRFGRIDGVSSAGARGPMQFLPATWARYGEGDVEDQRAAILGAARYLVANGAPGDMSRALFRYNPSRGYVRAIRFYARHMQEDRRAFLGFYSWRVLYKHVDGTMILPEGYPEERPVPVPVE